MNICLITPYPNPEDRHAKNTGVGSYSTYLAESLENQGNTLKIYAQIDAIGRDYTTGNISVERVWKKTFGGLWSLLWKIWKDKNKIVHIQHELNMFGQEALLPFTPLIPLVARLSGARVITTFHGGTGLACIDRDFVIENGKKLPPWIIRLAFRYIFGLFALASDHIIVHEEFQKRELIDEHHISPSKITVVPHGVPENPEIITDAREQLGLPTNKKILLYMGFAARYKWLPELYSAYREYTETHPDTHLIIGAWPAPRLEQDREYMMWYDSLRADFESLGESVGWTWFIDWRDISTYYSAADAILFPYSRRLAASGPMALAIGYEKPIVLSSVMQGLPWEYVFDFENILDTTKLKKERTWGKVSIETIKTYQK
jgi:glycosyltransferase involved in cell wall biosynthesis